MHGRMCPGQSPATHRQFCGQDTMCRYPTPPYHQSNHTMCSPLSLTKPCKNHTMYLDCYSALVVQRRMQAIPRMGGFPMFTRKPEAAITWCNLPGRGIRSEARARVLLLSLAPTVAMPQNKVIAGRRGTWNDQPGIIV